MFDRRWRWTGSSNRYSAIFLPVDKTLLLQHLKALLRQKLDDAKNEIASTRETFIRDTKSSAGDKHEVGRAMVQQELDKLEDQHAKLIVLQQELARVPLERVFDRVAFGSLVTTDQGCCFVAIGLGRNAVASDTFFAVSLASPIGQALNGKRVGEAAFFNGKSITVLDIA